MKTGRSFGSKPVLPCLLIGALTLAGVPASAAGDDNRMLQFASSYAAAWSSQDPAALAAHYAEDGVLIVNGSAPSIGRAAIESKACGFMTAFPDMTVSLLGLEQKGETTLFHWRWTGTNTGPGGTGNAVDLRGHEEWTLDEAGLIAQSLGHYDEADYKRQVNASNAKP